MPKLKMKKEVTMHKIHIRRIALFTATTLIACATMNIVAFAQTSTTTIVPVQSTGDPLLDAFVSFAAVAIPALGTALVTFAKMHWKVLDDLSRNQMLAAAASRLGAIALQSSPELLQLLTKGTPSSMQEAMAHPDVANAALSLQKTYPDTAKALSLTNEQARTFIVAESAKLATLPIVNSQVEVSSTPMIVPPFKPASPLGGAATSTSSVGSIATK
jgi:hypothetical protein